MKDRPAYLPLYVRDFISDPKVLALAWLEQVIYLRMLMLSWELGPLPDDPASIERMIGLGADQRISPATDSIRSILSACWEQTEEGWVSLRLEFERTRWDEMRAGRTDKARLAANARWSRRDAPSIAQAMLGDANPQAQAQAQAQAHTNPFRTEGGAVERAENEGEPPQEKIRIESWAGTLPVSLHAPGFPQEWEARLLYKRKQFRKPVSQASGDAMLELLVEVGPVIAARALKQARASGWTAPDLTKFKQAKDRAQVSRAVPSEIYRGPCCSVCGHQGWPREDGACGGCKRMWRDGREPLQGATSVST